MNPTVAIFGALFMIVAGTGLLYVIISRSKSILPVDGLQWASSLMSLGVVGCGIFIMLLAFGDGETTVQRTGVASSDEILELDLMQPAEDFEFRLVENDWSSQLNVYRGKVIVLNVWATWCAPCLDEIPALNRLQEEYGDDGLVVVSLSDEPRAELRAFDETMPLKTVSGYIPGGTPLPKTIEKAFEIRPTSYVIDREGNMRKYILGARNYQYFERAVTPYL